MNVPVVYLSFQQWRELRGHDPDFDFELRWAVMVEDRRVAKVWLFHVLSSFCPSVSR